MLIIGIAGGIASGKSVVADLFREKGAYVLDADRVGHEVLLQPDIVDQIRSRWGDEVLSDDGTVDRKKLGQIVFNPDFAGSELAELERMTHPVIRRRLEHQARELESEKFPIAILDAPVMFKAGWNNFCDRIVFVDCDEDRRAGHARQRGWSTEEFQRREAAQTPVDVKRAHAHWIIVNNGSLADLRYEAEQVWHEIRHETH